MAAPPLFAGALKLIVAVIELVVVAAPIVGAPGVSIEVVIELEADEAFEVRVPL
jgi:hypothetical protein